MYKVHLLSREELFMLPYPVVIYIKAKKDKHEQVIDTINAAKSVFQKTDNHCLEYNVYQDKNNSQMIIIYELWASYDDFLAHLATYGVPLAQAIENCLESLSIHELNRK